MEMNSKPFPLPQSNISWSLGVISLLVLLVVHHTVSRIHLSRVRYIVKVGGGGTGDSALILTQTTALAPYLVMSHPASPPLCPSLKPEQSFQNAN